MNKASEDENQQLLHACSGLLNTMKELGRGIDRLSDSIENCRNVMDDLNRRPVLNIAENGESKTNTPKSPSYLSVAQTQPVCDQDAHPVTPRVVAHQLRKQQKKEVFPHPAYEDDSTQSPKESSTRAWAKKQSPKGRRKK